MTHQNQNRHSVINALPYVTYLYTEHKSSSVTQNKYPVLMYC